MLRLFCGMSLFRWQPLSPNTSSCFCWTNKCFLFVNGSKICQICSKVTRTTPGWSTVGHVALEDSGRVATLLSWQQRPAGARWKTWMRNLMIPVWTLVCGVLLGLNKHGSLFSREVEIICWLPGQRDIRMSWTWSKKSSSVMSKLVLSCLSVASTQTGF